LKTYFFKRKKLLTSGCLHKAKTFAQLSRYRFGNSLKLAGLYHAKVEKAAVGCLLIFLLSDWIHYMDLDGVPQRAENFYSFKEVRNWAFY